MMRIGITGNMGSGKSTIAKVFSCLGIPVYDADSQAKRLMVESAHLKNAIISLFGSEAYLADGTLNKKYIAQQAFNNNLLLAQLNEQVHPAVYEDFERWCHQNRHATPYLIKEAALMFETESYKQLDKIILVSAPQELCIERTMKRDRSSRKDVMIRMQNQWSEAEKAKLANFIVYNDNAQLVIPQVIKLHHIFAVV
jgi:dephospho-CoA kinase